MEGSEVEREALRPVASRVRAAARWAWHPDNRWFVLAVLVALVLRLAWAIWTTSSTVTPRADNGRYLTAAAQLAAGGTPADPEGDPSAANALGYPLLLAPALWVAGKVGSPSYAFAASLVNVVLGTASVGFAGLLARSWIGRTARTPAAWLLALAPPHVYFTSVAMTETAFVTFTLGGLVVATWLTAPGRRPKRWAWGAYGLLVGGAALINPGGIVLLLAPILMRCTRRWAWRPADWRRGAGGVGWAVLGMVLVLAPTGVRNGVEVGIWSPFPSSNAMAVCIGHRDEATGTEQVVDDDFVTDCFSHEAPLPGEQPDQQFARWLAEDPDERDWYYTNVAEAPRWAISHPVEEVRLSVLKLWASFKTSDGALSAAEDFGAQPISGGIPREGLGWLAQLWHFGVLALAALGLAVVQRCRRAVPIWATSGLLALGILVVHGSSRYNHTSMALLAIVAAGGLAALVAGGRTLAVAAPAPEGVVAAAGPAG
ncbi:hypothetical protein B7486_52500 [cyanobacterium TDX16]|nr:hypothetical protein B7486_52500 [cyanobacterium TDX16]